MSEWIPVTQMLPKYDEFVFVATQAGPGDFYYHVARVIASWGNDVDGWRDGFGHRVSYVTHWMNIEQPSLHRDRDSQAAEAVKAANAIAVELDRIIDEAEVGIAGERLAGNVVKEEFWRGQKNAAKQIKLWMEAQ